MTIDKNIVRIIGERILNAGENPKRNKPYTIDDVTNAEYKQAVIAYISAKLDATEG